MAIKRREKDLGETLGGQDLNLSDEPAPLRIIIGGPPHSGKSTLMHLLENKFNEYHVPVELVDMDLSAPTDLRSKEGFTRTRDKRDWTLDLAKEAQLLFEDAEGSDVVLGDSVGLISSITAILSQPADVAILIASGNKGDDHNVYRKVIHKWKDFFGHLRKPLLVVVRSSMNPDEMSMFDPQDNYGVIVGLDRKAFEDELINPQDACVEGIVFEIAQAFDLVVSSSPTPAHLERIQDKWPSVKDIDTWTPETAPNLTPEKRERLSKIENDYFRERENEDFILGDDYRNRQAESFNAELEEEEFGEYSFDMDVYDDILTYALLDWDLDLDSMPEGGFVEIYVNGASVGDAYVWWDSEMEKELGGEHPYIIINNEMFHLNDLKQSASSFGADYRNRQAESFNAQMLEAKGKLWHKDKSKRKGRDYWEQKSRLSIRQDPEFIQVQRYLLGGMGVGILSYLWYKKNRQGEV